MTQQGKALQAWRDVARKTWVGFSKALQVGRGRVGHEPVRIDVALQAWLDRARMTWQGKALQVRNALA